MRDRAGRRLSEHARWRRPCSSPPTRGGAERCRAGDGRLRSRPAASCCCSVTAAAPPTRSTWPASCPAATCSTATPLPGDGAGRHDCSGDRDRQRLRVRPRVRAAVRASGGAGDVVIGLSTSGASANVLEALRAARRAGMLTIAFAGEGGCADGGRREHLLTIPAQTHADPGGHDAGAAHDLRAGRAQPVRAMTRPAAFLDRDGTINEKAPEGDYITTPDRLTLLPGAAHAIRRLNDAGALVIVVTNQRGIALGRMTEADLIDVHAQLRSLLEKQAGARLDAIFHCPHDAGACHCRKPAPGLIYQARAWRPEIDLARSIIIGDSRTDSAAGRAGRSEHDSPRRGRRRPCGRGRQRPIQDPPRRTDEVRPTERTAPCYTVTLTRPRLAPSRVLVAFWRHRLS